MTQNVAMLEAMMNPREATTYAERYKRFRRCYRLENSQAGPSRLVTRSKARELQDRFGGDVVRVVEALPHTMTQAEWHSLGRPSCPFCGAEEGAPCITRFGRERVPHDKRPYAGEVSHGR